LSTEIWTVVYLFPRQEGISKCGTSRSCNDTPATGISYLVSKAIATVINQQIIREKNNPFIIHRNYMVCKREEYASWPTSEIRLASKSKTDNPNQYPWHSSWAQHIYYVWSLAEFILKMRR
jgi:hypothetical protein